MSYELLDEFVEVDVVDDGEESCVRNDLGGECSFRVWKW